VLKGHGWKQFWALHPILPVFVWTPLWTCATHVTSKFHYIHQFNGFCKASLIYFSYCLSRHASVRASLLAAIVSAHLCTRLPKRRPV
jgi:hypothetical protein